MSSTPSLGWSTFVFPSEMTAGWWLPCPLGFSRSRLPRGRLHAVHAHRLARSGNFNEMITRELTFSESFRRLVPSSASPLQSHPRTLMREIFYHPNISNVLLNNVMSYQLSETLETYVTEEEGGRVGPTCHFVLDCLSQNLC